MEIEVNDNIAVIRSDDPIITDRQSALDLISTLVYDYDIHRLAVPSAAVTQDLFKLSTGAAGEVLQRFVGYGVKIAIFGDFTRYTSKSLHDYIYECNKGNAVFFTATEEEAIARLSAAK